MLTRMAFAGAGWVARLIALGEWEMARQAAPGAGEATWAEARCVVEQADAGSPCEFVDPGDVVVRRLSADSWWVRCQLWQGSSNGLAVQGRIARSSVISGHYDFLMEGVVPMDSPLPHDVQAAEPDVLEAPSPGLPDTARRPVPTDESASSLPREGLAVVRAVIDALVLGQAQRIGAVGGRLDGPIRDLERAIREAQQHFVALPDGFERWAIAGVLDDGSGWWVDCPVWTADGASDWEVSGRLLKPTHSSGYVFVVHDFLMP